MKIVIDIPEDAFLACKYWLNEGVAQWAETIIANGAPYEERPKGEWIEMTDGRGHNSYFCSRCGTQEGKRYGYCPNCEAKMMKEANNE